jgi:DGQHR domain-containing protein
LLDPLKISTQPLSIKVPRNNYEIDVLAEFEDVFVAIECKSGFSNDISSHIDKITANKGDVQARLRKLSSNDKPCLFLIVYSENEVTPSNFQKAKSDKIDIWNEKIFSEYFMIAKKLKSSGKAIIISDLLAQKNIKWGHKNRRYNCLVTKGTYKDKYDCFSFQMSPEELLKIAYVHRRNFLNSLDKDNTTVTYQRMINTTKIKNIQKYLQIPGNSFPTPILINFEKELTFSEIPERNAEKRTGNVTPGWLTFPEEFGYAWIIDGQHRLFGYSGLKEKSETDMLNVIAFSQLDQVEQANLFVDINQNQKRIPPDYLWDLYTDIYPEDNTLYQISWLVKELNNKSVFFKDRIYIPSISTRESKSYSLKINNIGVSMKNKISNVYKKTLQEDLDRYYGSA